MDGLGELLLVFWSAMIWTSEMTRQHDFEPHFE